MTTPLLEVDKLTMHFPIKGGFWNRPIGSVQALTDVSFDLQEGETLGIVGESGCGKTTLGRTIVRLYEPTSGSLKFAGQDFTLQPQNTLKPLRRNMQMIFQDPYGSLNPRMSVGEILEEPLKLHNIGNKSERKERVKNLLELVGLRPHVIERFPHEFSGGQRQRISIARSLALNPKLIIADEPVSALDVSIQSQVLNLLMELQEKLKLTYIFISHDLAVVRHIAKRVAVMYLGRIIEIGDTERIFSNPTHPYTKALLQSIPVPDPHRRGIHQGACLEGDLPSPSNPPSGCAFHARCPVVLKECALQRPLLESAKDFNDPHHQAACHHLSRKGSLQ